MHKTVEKHKEMIRAIVVVNNHGRARLLKFYENMTYDEERKLIRDIFNVVSRRGDRLCNFVEREDGSKLIYRHYATLYFVFLVDSSESELGILDLIQVVVETLDKSFESVCELDVIFHSDRVHHMLDEIITGGLVGETSVTEIMRTVDAMNKHDSQSLRTTRPGQKS